MNLDMEKYKQVRMAQANGARTIEDLKDVIIASDEEREEIEKLLKNACRCKNVSIETIVNAVKDGADTVDKVVEVTGAGSACGRCKGIIGNIIEIKR